jgi:hypothetical protein
VALDAAACRPAKGLVPHEPAPVPDFRYFDRLRVRWAEVDMQKIVFNGHYLMYFDTAVAGYWRALALPYARDDGAAAGRPVRAQGHARIRGLGALRRPAAGGPALRAHRQLVAGAARARCSAATAAGARRAGLRLRRPGHADVAARAARPARGSGGLRGRQAHGRRARGHLGRARPRGPGHPPRASSSTSRRSRPTWNGTLPMPMRCTSWCATASAACRWPAAA